MAIRVEVKLDDDRTEIMRNIKSIKIDIGNGYLEMRVTHESGGSFLYSQVPDHVLIEEENKDGE